MATPKSATQVNMNDAIAMLMADHRKVKALFREFDSLKSSGATVDKAALVDEICEELTVHAALEEEIFYPAVRAALDDDDLMDEALVEHAGARDLIAQLQGMHPRDELYDARVTVPCEQVDHHVREEEGLMFPMVLKAKVDTATLGSRMSARKIALTGEGYDLQIYEEDEQEGELRLKRVAR